MKKGKETLRIEVRISNNRKMYVIFGQRDSEMMEVLSFKTEIGLNAVLQLARSKAYDIADRENVEVEVYDCVNSTVLICDACGSEDVETKVWMSLKDGSIDDCDGGGGGGKNDNFCNNCEERDGFNSKVVTEPILTCKF